MQINFFLIQKLIGLKRRTKRKKKQTAKKLSHKSSSIGSASSAKPLSKDNMAERAKREANRRPRRTLGDYANQQGPKHFSNIVIPPSSSREFKRICCVKIRRDQSWKRKPSWSLRWVCEWLWGHRGGGDIPTTCISTIFHSLLFVVMEASQLWKVKSSVGSSL